MRCWKQDADLHILKKGHEMLSRISVVYRLIDNSHLPRTCLADGVACSVVVQCGFFKRNKPGDDSGLYKAKMEKQRDYIDYD